MSHSALIGGRSHPVQNMTPSILQVSNSQLFHIFIYLTSSPTDFQHWNIHHGWILDSSSNLLFWVPPHNRPGLLWPGNLAVMGPPPTKLDVKQFVHGQHWKLCKSHSSTL